MQRLPLPSSRHPDIFKRCYEAYTQSAQTLLKARAKNSEYHIELMSQCYAYAAENGAFHRIPVHDRLGSMTASDFKKLYRGQVASLAGKCRDLYDDIYSSPRFGTCPLCLQRTVSQIDHYLCQAFYPAFAVDPQNLVPSCGECNKSKRDMVIESPTERTVHPYFDTLPEVWLECTINQTSDIIDDFSVSGRVLGDIARILTFHLNRLELGRLYKSHAASVLYKKRATLVKLHAIGGAATVREHLIDCLAEAERISPNTWESALFRTLSNSNWFCSTGFFGIES